MSFNIVDYPSLLEEIRKRPQMWHNGETRSALLLKTFISGFQYSQNFHKVESGNLLGGFNWGDFEKWVEVKFNPKRKSYDSFTWAIYLSDSEAEAFDLWFSWYDLYKSETVED